MGIYNNIVKTFSGRWPIAAVHYHAGWSDIALRRSTSGHRLGRSTEFAHARGALPLGKRPAQRGVEFRRPRAR